MTTGKVGDKITPLPVRSEPRKTACETVTGRSHLRTHTTYPNVYIVVIGTMTEGYDFYGPFKCAETAMQWVADNIKIGESMQIYPMSHVRGVRGEVETTA